MPKLWSICLYPSATTANESRARNNRYVDIKPCHFLFIFTLYCCCCIFRSEPLFKSAFSAMLIFFLGILFFFFTFFLQCYFLHFLFLWLLFYRSSRCTRIFVLPCFYDSLFSLFVCRCRIDMHLLFDCDLLLWCSFTSILLLLNRNYQLKFAELGSIWAIYISATGFIGRYVLP